jgi:cytochrome c oxidase subunit 1
LVFIPLFFLGMYGDHRRIYNYLNFPDSAAPFLQDMRVFSTLALVVMLLFQLVFFFNFFWSMFKGEKAGKNPWNATTLEWTTESPAPHGNWKELPTCYRGPYEYSVPGRKTDFWPQNEPT